MNLSTCALLIAFAVLPGCSNTQPRSVLDKGVPVSIGLSEKQHSVDSYYAKHVDRVAPAIAYIQSHIDEHGRLPTQRIFQQWADESGAHMLVIRDRQHKYAADHGAENDADYLVGTWMSDWYFYYKSWDQEYINASDETQMGYTLD